MQSLRRQIHELARLAVAVVARGMQYLTPMPFLMHLGWHVLCARAQFCVDEADASGGAPPDGLWIFEMCVTSLILFNRALTHSTLLLSYSDYRMYSR
jgi:hypothetical protein